MEANKLSKPIRFVIACMALLMSFGNGVFFASIGGCGDFGVIVGLSIILAGALIGTCFGMYGLWWKWRGEYLRV